MGAIVNGLVLSGFARTGRLPHLQRLHEGLDPARRRSCTSRPPSCSRHDSIGVGEDGPTHQPIEQLVTPCARRRTSTSCARPGFNETALAWRHALRQTNRRRFSPSRARACPVWDPARCPDDAIERGA
jgi:transketolase